jgi:uncharacterized membrane protein YgcG
MRALAAGTRAVHCAGASRRRGPAAVMVAFAVTLTLLLPLTSAAQERIRAYDIGVDIRADGSIDVTEHITVHAEGSSIRRGIYRDFPTVYRDRHGNRVRVRLDVLGVERDGRPEAWFTEGLSNGVRINTGGDDYLPALPAEYTFTIRYRTTRQLGFFDAHDELYWNAIGTGWIFPIESGTVTVRLPEPVPADRMSVEAYTGAQGRQGTAYTAEVESPGVAHYALAAPLGAHEGFTIVLTFPKGLVAEPSSGQRVGWFLRDNGGVLAALAGLFALLWFGSLTWWRVGRDPRRGVVVPRYEPPAQHTPAALRYVRRMGYDMRCFSADLLALAVAGHVRIHRDRKRFSEKWRLERTIPSATDTADATASPAVAIAARTTPVQQPLIDSLFTGGSTTLDLENSNAATVAGARDAHSKALDQALHPRYFERNTGPTRIALAITVVTALVAFPLSGGAGIPAIMLVLVIMMIVLAVFGRLVRAPTQEGRRLLDEIEGLKLYLGVAERDDLARVESPDAPPQLDAGRYEALLPYAVALEVEDAWTKKFTLAAGAAAVAAATQRMGWYSGTGRASDLGDFTRAIGTSLSSSIASASTPPGSSSGSGGGGSSGGGGGGGGGGGR